MSLPSSASRSRVAPARWGDEPCVTANMSAAQQRVVAAEKEAYLAPRKAKRVDREDFLELERVTKIARDARIADSRAAKAAAAAAAPAADEPPLAALQPEPELEVEPVLAPAPADFAAGLGGGGDGGGADLASEASEPAGGDGGALPEQEEQEEIEVWDLTGDTSGEEDEAPPPPPPPPPVQHAPPRRARAAVQYLPAHMEAMAAISEAKQPAAWEVEDDEACVALGLETKGDLTNALDGVHVDLGLMYPEGDKRSKKAVVGGKTVPQYSTALAVFCRSPLAPKSLQEVYDWRAEHKGLNQTQLAIQVVVPTLFPELCDAMKAAGIELHSKHSVVKRTTSWLAGVGKGDGSASKLGALLELARAAA